MQYFSKEHLINNKESLLMLYEQACENARAYMDLRFKHFTTFMFLTGLLGALTFQIESLRSFRPIFSTVAISLTVLFWLLDNRTGYYQKLELTKIQFYELIIGAYAISPPRKIIRKISATLVTNLIFLVILFSWGFMTVTQRQVPDVQSPTTGNHQSNNMTATPYTDIRCVIVEGDKRLTEGEKIPVDKNASHEQTEQVEQKQSGGEMKEKSAPEAMKK